MSNDLLMSVTSRINPITDDLEDHMSSVVRPVMDCHQVIKFYSVWWKTVSQ